MYNINSLKIKEKNRNVRKSFIMTSKVFKNLKVYIFYRVAGPAFQAVAMFWK